MTDDISFPGNLSLLGQIVTAAEKLDDGQKQALLLALRRDELLQKAAALDQRLQPGALSDEEILALCKMARKERYSRRELGAGHQYV